MEFKAILFSFILLIFVDDINAQNEQVQCIYNITGGAYTCNLYIFNPNGLDNFADISGTHLIGKNDRDVLKIMEVSGSNTSNIPSIICEKFCNLQSITLPSVGIRKIDEYSFKKCKQLSYLFLEKNQIAEIDENAFVENLNLRNLLLRTNQLTTLPENVFINQRKLNLLWIHFNRISDLPKHIFKSLEALTDLSVSNNQISTIKAEWFETLENLNYLYLYSNPIGELPQNVFNPLKNLWQISLQNSKLEIIHSNSFSFHLNLSHIILFNNQINALDERLIDNTGVTNLFMEYNICANTTIEDSSPTRNSMRAELRRCFENYENLVTETTTVISTTTQTLPPGCNDENITERICVLEDENEMFKRKNEELQEKLENLTKNFNERSQAVDDAIEELENKLLEFMSRPCSCR